MNDGRRGAVHFCHVKKFGKRRLFLKSPFWSLLRRQRSEKGLLYFLGQCSTRGANDVRTRNEIRAATEKAGSKNSGVTTLTSQMFLSLLEPATNCELLELSFEVGVRRSV